MPRDIIVIGGSAGALQVLETLLQQLPPTIPASIFVVLHISPNIGSRVATILSACTALKVINPTDGVPFKTGTVYVAPADHHMRLLQNGMELDRGPKENRNRPAIDVLFRSAAWEYGPRVIGVVLTGSLDDGTAGLWEIKKHGGVAVVQSPEEAVYPSMPLSAIRQVHVDYIVPVKNMAPLLLSLCTGKPMPQTMAESRGEELEP